MRDDESAADISRLRLEWLETAEAQARAEISRLRSELAAATEQRNDATRMWSVTSDKLAAETKRADTAGAEVKLAETAMEEGTKLLIEAATDMLGLARREQQIRALANRWDEREAAFMSSKAGIFAESFAMLNPTPQEAAAAATAMCAAQLRALLRCDNPHCPCKPEATESATIKAGSGDDQPSP